jgi:hypothetical protein
MITFARIVIPPLLVIWKKPPMDAMPGIMAPHKAEVF